MFRKTFTLVEIFSNGKGKITTFHRKKKNEIETIKELALRNCKTCTFINKTAMMVWY